MDPMKPMEPMKPGGHPTMGPPPVPTGSSSPPVKIERPAGDLHPKFKLGAIIGALGILAVAAVNAMGQFGIKPKGFVGMGLTFIATLAGVYSARGDGR